MCIGLSLRTGGYLLQQGQKMNTSVAKGESGRQDFFLGSMVGEWTGKKIRIVLWMV